MKQRDRDDSLYKLIQLYLGNIFKQALEDDRGVRDTDQFSNYAVRRFQKNETADYKKTIFSEYFVFRLKHWQFLSRRELFTNTKIYETKWIRPD